MIEKAFKARTDLQYYANRPVDEKVIEEIKQHETKHKTHTSNAEQIVNEVKETTQKEKTAQH